MSKPPRARVALVCATLLSPTVSFAQSSQVPGQLPKNETAETSDVLPGEPGADESGGSEAPLAESPGESPPVVQETEEETAQNSEEETAGSGAATAPVSPAETPTLTATPPAPVEPQPTEPEKTEQKEEPRKMEISGAPGKGVTIQPSKNFSLNVRSRIQLRYQLNVPREDEAGERELEQLVNISTARLWFSGHLFQPELTYMIQLAVADRDFRDGAKSPIYDAYLDYAAHRDLSVRAGQFFVPFDRLRTVREWALQMADRPRPVLELTLDRDVGVMLYSERFLSDKSPLAWRIGAFGGGGTNLSTGREPGGLFVGRLELRPLGPLDDDREGDLERRVKPAIALGAGVAKNFNTDRLRSTTGPRFLGGTTDYLHLAADAVFKWRGLALQGEYLWKDASADQIESIGDDGLLLTEATRSGYGWVAQASYVFDPPVELVGRLARLYARSGTDPLLLTEAQTRGQEVGAGINYYFNGHWMKIQADWIALMPPDFEFSQADHVTHLQLDVTF